MTSTTHDRTRKSAHKALLLFLRTEEGLEQKSQHQQPRRSKRRTICTLCLVLRCCWCRDFCPSLSWVLTPHARIFLCDHVWWTPREKLHHNEGLFLLTFGFFLFSLLCLGPFLNESFMQISLYLNLLSDFINSPETRSGVIEIEFGCSAIQCYCRRPTRIT